MSSDVHRDSFEVLAWSGTAADLERLPIIVYSRLRDDLDAAVSDARRDAEESKKGDHPSYWDDIDQALDRKVIEIKEAYEVHAEIVSGTRQRTSVGPPGEIVSRVDARRGPDLDIECPGPSIYIVSRNIVRISLTARHGVTVSIEGDSEDWVRGTYDKLFEEVQMQVPRDAWVKSPKTFIAIISLAILAFVYAVATFSRAPLIGAVMALIAFGVATGANVVISRFRSFELLPAGKSSRSSRTAQVVAYLAAAPLGAVVSQYFQIR